MVAALLPWAVAGAARADDTADGPAALASVEAQRLTPPMRSFTLLGVGDLLAEAPVNRAAAAAAPSGTRYDVAPLLAPIASIVASADLAICHMETPITAPGGRAGFIARSAYGSSLLAAPHEVADGLRRVGFDRCSTASNHSWDLTADGIRTTLEALDAAGLGHSGTARSPAESQVTVFDVNSVKVAHLSYARNSNTGFPREPWRLNRIVSAADVARDTAAARSLGAEVVVVSLHVFVEMQKAPHFSDRALVTAIAAQAAPDVVLVTGPHVPQPMERVGPTLVWWSLGNFMSGMGVPGRGKYEDPRTLDGLMATVRLTEQPDGSWAAEPATVLLCNAVSNRFVYPGVTAQNSADMSSSLRTQLRACVARSAWLPTTLS
ncbi:MAG: Capsule biosynthesis protein CapA [Actinomycetota bacterium]